MMAKLSFNPDSLPTEAVNYLSDPGFNDIAATAVVSSGAITTSGGAVSTVSTVTNAVTLPTIPADWITSSGVAASAVTEMQSGLATSASIAALNNLSSADVTAAVPTATDNADALLNRDMAAVSDTNSRSPLNALRFLRNKWGSVAGTLTIYAEDDATPKWSAALTSDASAEPIISVDPS